MHLPDGKVARFKWLLGLLLGALSLYSVFNEYRLINDGIYVNARVVSLDCRVLFVNLIVPVIKPEINPLCLPIVEFTDNNQTVHYKLNYNQNLFIDRQLGAVIPLYYQNINPQNVVTNNFADKYLSYLWDAVLAGVAFIKNPKKKEQYIRV